MQALSGDAYLKATTNYTRFNFIQNATNNGSLTLAGSREEALSQNRGRLFAHVGVGEPGD